MEIEKVYAIEVGLGTNSAKIAVRLRDGSLETREFWADPMPIGEITRYTRLIETTNTAAFDNDDANQFYVDLFNKRRVSGEPITLEWLNTNLQVAEVVKIVVILSGGLLVTPLLEPGGAEGNASRPSRKTGASSTRSSPSTTGSNRKISKR